MNLSVSSNGTSKVEAVYNDLVAQYGLPAIILLLLENSSSAEHSVPVPGDTTQTMSGLQSTLATLKDAYDL